MTELPPARILDVQPDAYHKLSGLSPSLAHTLMSSCQEIARYKYERQIDGAADEAENDSDSDSDAAATVDPQKQKRLDRGDVMHAMTLGVGKRLEVIPSADLGKGGKYTTARSKELRDAARAAGKIPVKEPDMIVYRRCVDAIRARLADAGHVLDGRSELAIEWWESSAHGPVQCRTMLDHLKLLAADGLQATIPPEPPVTIRPAFAKVYELKFPEDAHPDRSERTADSLSYQISHAARLRALDALFPSLAGRIEYRFLICETHRPYAFWDPTPTGAFTELGQRQWRTAVDLWAAGLKSGRWIGYHDDIMRRKIDLTSWRKLQEGFTDDE